MNEMRILAVHSMKTGKCDVTVMNGIEQVSHHEGLTPEDADVVAARYPTAVKHLRDDGGQFFEFKHPYAILKERRFEKPSERKNVQNGEGLKDKVKRKVSEHKKYKEVKKKLNK